MSNTFKKQILIPMLSLGGFLLAVIFYNNYDSNRRENALEKHAFNFGIGRNKSSSSNGSKRFIIKHSINGKEYIAESISVSSPDLTMSCFLERKIGDTIFIKYSIDNPEIVRIETCYWNREKQIDQIK